MPSSLKPEGIFMIPDQTIIEYELDINFHLTSKNNPISLQHYSLLNGSGNGVSLFDGGRIGIINSG